MGVGNYRLAKCLLLYVIVQFLTKVELLLAMKVSFRLMNGKINFSLVSLL